MPVSIEVSARSSRRFSEIVELSDMRRFDDWCRTLGVTRNQLVMAVTAVGEDAGAIKMFLRRRGH